MVRKTGFILSAVFLVLLIFVGCSTIPLDEGKRYEGVVTVDYHFNAQGTTTDGLGVKLTWDIITTARRYRVILRDGSSNTIVDTTFPSYEVSGGDTAFNNNWTLAQAEQLGTYTVLYSKQADGNVWETDTVGQTSSIALSGSSCLVAYGLDGSFAAFWNDENFQTIGFGDSSLHTVAEVYFYDPCDSLNRIDTLVYTIDTLTNDTTIVTDTALAFTEILSAFMPPFSGGQQAGVLNVGSDTAFANLRIAPMGDQLLYESPVVDEDIVWMQSASGRYAKIMVDSIITSPPTSDLESAVIYFHWAYQRLPKFRYVY
ncbi:hypothetical protein JXA84_03290 [candidate division WOR-3 bacterium]|nr:hypothetical protein [candidate division WOR-3 bacterium]